MFYPQVALRTFQNAAVLTEAYFADPFPITRAVLANQIAALSDAATALADGDGDAAFSALVGVIAQPWKISEAATVYLNRTYNQPYQDLLFPIVTVAPFVNLVAAAGVALKDVVEAAMTIDVIGLVNAIVDIPARILDGFLNGGYFEHSPGLVSPYDPQEWTLPGPLALLTDFIQGTAESIAPWSSTAPPIPEQSATDDDEESPTAVGDVPTVALEAGDAVTDGSAREPAEPEREDDVAAGDDDEDHPAAPVTDRGEPEQSDTGEQTVRAD
ncbi:hypothetical protein [Mycolicibacterium austroafricanum]|uniref:hypothetical protein n=1 Tax=Mycolicibacterium austroafricanum TaxID=39687 RepID=UPI001CA348EE|nr:hypothetical protein [Mycolicibacterium austroafricanum]QZT62564.1 hypothetical protein JN085_27500 [Mycolicibacterium austroafricanum]